MVSCFKLTTTRTKSVNGISVPTWSVERILFYRLPSLILSHNNSREVDGAMEVRTVDPEAGGPIDSAQPCKIMWTRLCTAVISCRDFPGRSLVHELNRPTFTCTHQSAEAAKYCERLQVASLMLIQLSRMDVLSQQIRRAVSRLHPLAASCLDSSVTLKLSRSLYENASISN